ncbi:MAG: metallophosphoesterase family protein [Desulfuromonadales bacterium]|nr:metallophosphoesterase family protein [Desulfuromonadales bacterium]
MLGIVSDTHGLVRNEALEALRGVDLIIHAGDVGGSTVLPALQAIAPVVAVRGNVDADPSIARLPQTATVEAEPLLIYILHDLNQLNFDPLTTGFHIIISGHTHRPSVIRQGQVLYLNPGSLGPKRFRLPVSLALLRLRGSQSEPKILNLNL